MLDVASEIVVPLDDKLTSPVMGLIYNTTTPTRSFVMFTAEIPAPCGHEKLQLDLQFNSIVTFIMIGTMVVVTPTYSFET